MNSRTLKNQLKNGSALIRLSYYDLPATNLLGIGHFEHKSRIEYRILRQYLKFTVLCQDIELIKTSIALEAEL